MIPRKDFGLHCGWCFVRYPIELNYTRLELGAPLKWAAFKMSLVRSSPHSFWCFSKFLRSRCSKPSPDTTPQTLVHQETLCFGFQISCGVFRAAPPPTSTQSWLSLGWAKSIVICPSPSSNRNPLMTQFGQRSTSNDDQRTPRLHQIFRTFARLPFPRRFPDTFHRSADLALYQNL